jgi:hypothetical protein
MKVVGEYGDRLLVAESESPEPDTDAFVFGTDTSSEWQPLLSFLLRTPWQPTDQSVTAHIRDAAPAANAQYAAGDEVEVPDGPGVVVDVLTDDIPDDAPDADTIYVVAHEDGFGFYDTESVEKSEIPVDEPSKVEVKADNPTANDWSHPPSWRKSEQPARLILLKAWAGMGGTFRGCRSEMGGPQYNDFCAAMKDAVLGTEEWRGGWA